MVSHFYQSGKLSLRYASSGSSYRGISNFKEFLDLDKPHRYGPNFRFELGKDLGLGVGSLLDFDSVSHTTEAAYFLQGKPTSIVPININGRTWPTFIQPRETTVTSGLLNGLRGFNQGNGFNCLKRSPITIPVQLFLHSRDGFPVNKRDVQSFLGLNFRRILDEVESENGDLGRQRNVYKVGLNQEAFYVDDASDGGIVITFFHSPGGSSGASVASKYAEQLAIKINRDYPAQDFDRVAILSNRIIGDSTWVGSYPIKNLHSDFGVACDHAKRIVRLFNESKTNLDRRATQFKGFNNAFLSIIMCWNADAEAALAALPLDRNYIFSEIKGDVIEMSFTGPVHQTPLTAYDPNVAQLFSYYLEQLNGDKQQLYYLINDLCVSAGLAMTFQSHRSLTGPGIDYAHKGASDWASHPRNL